MWFLIGLFIVGSGVSLGVAIFAYFDGRDDGYRYGGWSKSGYYNGWQGPWAYAYEYGYRATEGKRRVNTRDKNKKKFKRD